MTVSSVGCPGRLSRAAAPGDPLRADSADSGLPGMGLGPRDDAVEWPVHQTARTRDMGSPACTGPPGSGLRRAPAKFLKPLTQVGVVRLGVWRPAAHGVLKGANWRARHMPKLPNRRTDVGRLTQLSTTGEN